MRILDTLHRVLVGQVLVTTLMLTGSVYATEEEIIINLKCQGTGEKSVENSDGSAEVVEKRPFNGVVFIEIRDDTGQVKLPMAMFPQLNRQQVGQWLPLEELMIRRTQITGNVMFNASKHLNLVVDRVTSEITLVGKLSDFTGECKSSDSDSEPLF